MHLAFPIKKRAMSSINPNTSAFESSSLRLRHQSIRQIILAVICISSIVTIVLGFIYAYCVAKPYDNKSTLAQRSWDLSSKRDTASSVNWDSTINHINNTNANNQSHSSTDSHSLLPLIFYTVTLPLLSVVHSSVELLVIFISKSNTSNGTSSKISSKSAFRQLMFSISTSVLLLAGWIISSSFWTTCELIHSSPSKSTTKNSVPAGPSFCPAQIRGHFMYGIHEVSIAKAVFAWLVVIIYSSFVVISLVGLRKASRGTQTNIMTVVLVDDSSNQSRGWGMEMDDMKAKKDKSGFMTTVTSV